MEARYTDERNAQIVIELLKAHQICKVVASPGSTNICLIASMQTDSYFQIFSAPDERSAAYMACGMAAESGEPVVLSCTGATASRNYYPGLTEAYYRKLPVLAITSSRRSERIGHNFDQVTDRTSCARDVVRLSVQMPVVHDKESEWGCMIAANKAMLELGRRGGGPVHINLETTYSTNCRVREIPPVRAIDRFTYGDKFPELTGDRVGIVVGAHVRWSGELTQAVESFCESHNGVVFCDHTSNYQGKYRIFPNLITHQKNYSSSLKQVDLVIHIGEISSSEYGIRSSQVWRVSPDGEIRDTFGKLKYVFELEEQDFFQYYAKEGSKKENTIFSEYQSEDEAIRRSLPQLPFSNAWIASVTSHRLPQNAVLHLGIRNSLRSWNFFDTCSGILGYSNTGGFGIDGSLSSLLGASLVHPDKIYYCVLGDLAFFYDMNVLGNRHIGNNIRILLINNGTGMEMRFSAFLATKINAKMDSFIAASGHYGNKSTSLVRHYAEDLGFEYLSASDKQKYLEMVNRFVDDRIGEKPQLFEVFVDPKKDDEAYNALSEIKTDRILEAKNTLYDMLGKKNVDTLKRLIKR